MSTLDSRSSRRAGVLVFFTVATLYFGWVIARFGINTPPSTSGDESSYDSIAWELSHGRGYAIDYADAEFREPYDRAAQQNAELFFLPMATVGTVAYRPPLIPVAVSIANRLLGRQHYFLRILNIIAMAATIGLIVWYLCSTVGWQVAAVITILFLVDVRSRLYARALLTESVSCLLCTLLAIALFSYSENGRLKTIAVCGACLGLSILARSIAILWAPGIAFTVLLIAARVHKKRWLRSAGISILFCFCTVAVLSPWAIRNVVLLQTFAPMGTQGLMELSAGYSDIAYNNYGVWQNVDAAEFFDKDAFKNLSGYTQELEIARQSKGKAFAWIRANTGRLPALAAMKVVSEFRPNDIAACIVMLFAAVGAACSIRNRDTQIMLALLLANTTAIAVTWSVEGRFLVPQLFCFYVLAGMGFQSCLTWLRSAFRERTAS